MELKNVKHIERGVIPGTKSPARYYPNLNGGTIVINEPIFARLIPEHRFFVLLHEAGHAHFEHRTKGKSANEIQNNEREADRWAFQQYVAHGYPLSEAVFSLTQILDKSRPAHNQRMREQFDRAAAYDINVNHNLKLKNTLKMNTNIENVDSKTLAWMQAAHTEFLGLGKEARARRKERREQRAEKKAAKNDVRKAKAEAIRSGNYKSGFAQGLGGIFDKAGSILGLGGGAEAPTAQPLDGPTPNDTPTPKKNNTLIIIIVVVVLAVAGYFIYKQSKKGKAGK